MELALDTPARLRAVPKAAPSPEPSVDVTDADLLVRVAERDRVAFEALYHRYVRSVFGIALRRLRDRQRAEDAVQETFAAVWRSAASYRPERGPAAPWLYAVARNAIVDRLRARSRAADGGAGHRLVASRARPSTQRRRSSRGASIARSRSCRRRSGRCRARLLERHVAERGRRLSPHPARHGQDAHPQRARPPGRPARGRAP